MKSYNLEDYEPFTFEDAEMFYRKDVIVNGKEKHNESYIEEVYTSIMYYTKNGVIINGVYGYEYDLALVEIKFLDGSPFGKLKDK